jgi:NADH dehydrogenase FAD-containing subunit
VRKGQLRVALESNVVEIKPSSVILNLGQQSEEIQNDFVWIFAGGVPPNDFLRKIGVGFGIEDMLSHVNQEKRPATAPAPGTPAAHAVAAGHSNSSTGCLT